MLEAGYEPGLLARRMREMLETFPLELEGRSVLVKPNMLGPWPGDSGAAGGEKVRAWGGLRPPCGLGRGPRAAAREERGNI